MRQLLKDQEVGLDPHFRYRGKNTTRVEAFSDAAFALGITLIVLSSSVPNTFRELWFSMREVVPFGMCVTLVMVIWYQHYLFFLKYGLQSRGVIVLNTVLIFLILVYVYPLKFLSRFLFEGVMALFTRDFSLLQQRFYSASQGDLDMKYLMVIYGTGVALIFFLIAMLYRYALSREAELDLSPYERFATKNGVIQNGLMASIPAMSALLSLIDFGSPAVTFSIAGFCYFLYPVVMFTYGFYVSGKQKRLFPETMH